MAAAKIETVRDLTPDPRNANRGTERGAGMLETSLREYGAGRSLLVDKHGVVIAGNKTLEAAASIGLQDVVVVPTDGTKLVIVQRTDLDLESDPRAKALGVADNRVAQVGLDWDTDVLRSLVADGTDLSKMFTEDEIAALLTKVQRDGLTDPDDVPAERDTNIAIGDMFQLGRHRLICGDATDVDVVTRLMGGKTADICFTSPPYALGASISLSGNKSMSSHGNAYDDHEDRSSDWPDLMDGWWSASMLAVNHGWIVNVQMLAGNKRQLIRWMNDRVDRIADIAIWDKGHAAPAMAAGVMSSRHELLIVLAGDNASRAIPCSSWRGTIQSVYEGPPQRNNEFSDIHAATMPVHLADWVIGQLCDTARIVYEPFTGTGTTMMSAEKIGKTCYGVELSPSYVQIAIDRWEQFTGEKAVKLDDHAGN